MKKNITKILIRVSRALLIVAGFSVALSGCKKEFLEPNPTSFFEPGETFTTKTGLDAALATADRHLRSFYTYTSVVESSLPISTDYMFSEMAVAGKTDNASILADIATRVAPTEMPERMTFFWDESYNGVKYANSILTFIDRVPGLDEASKNQYKGRALFHRSFHYLTLCMKFKDVPLVTKIIESPKTNYKSTRRETILQMITADVEQALAWVPEQKNMTRVGLVNQGACRQLLIKCYLATGQWQKAIDQADILINSSGFSLMTSNFGTFINPYPTTWAITRNVIWDLHRPENKAIAANKEVIMVMPNRNNTDMGMKMNPMRNWVPFLDNANTKTPAAARAVQYFPPNNASFRAQYNYVHAFGRGNAHMRPTWFAQESLWYLNGVNDAGDLRHNTTVGNWITMESVKYNVPTGNTWFGQNLRLYNGTTLLCTDTVRNWFDWPHYKYYVEDPLETADVGRTDHRGGAGDWYLYRLAETYLLRAEAKFYKGDATAVDDVNRIRQRANCTQLYTAVTIGDIMNERARELHMEEMRHTELSRVSYCLALSGKADEWGNTYNVNNLEQNSYWYQRIQRYSDFYNKGKVAVLNRQYTIAPHNIYWPIPSAAILPNGGNPLRQNKGYTGYNAGIPMWETWQEAVADEAKGD
ncbi:MAG: RagB/SusD family nutrient uptake outer membrane protein [Sphingobacteriaceae bacterium]|nr:RagB/SusD family nutrient uptake outer membrane protein [Sphingobacteriaceae bacterium]